MKGLLKAILVGGMLCYGIVAATASNGTPITTSLSETEEKSKEEEISATSSENSTTSLSETKTLNVPEANVVTNSASSGQLEETPVAVVSTILEPAVRVVESSPFLGEKFSDLRTAMATFIEDSSGLFSEGCEAVYKLTFVGESGGSSFCNWFSSKGKDELTESSS
ncbi:hypothetical protein HF1_01440 [Mycoplasma haemofelis str. Langford 1]|uniref:Lipoprotein n=2 Tax=Mycoplasma haemofelis TaxID=29501 RepID=F6FFZ8_MYCHI|nr:hypothetical protein [Mycoplasma haemofelis]AEG72464.1 hypothetical protein MHF_0163 [Mycoplasma haemofelis Ohio2]CBY92152.1 hypothetical protein HF1_01440 [Mycoplasma haemofelis str. Langford 1]